MSSLNNDEVAARFAELRFDGADRSAPGSAFSSAAEVVGSSVERGLVEVETSKRSRIRLSQDRLRSVFAELHPEVSRSGQVGVVSVEVDGDSLVLVAEYSL